MKIEKVKKENLHECKIHDQNPKRGKKVSLQFQHQAHHSGIPFYRGTRGAMQFHRKKTRRSINGRQLQEKDEKGNYQIEMVPDPPWQEINRIFLTVSPEHKIRSVRIFNALGSVTRFNLGDFTIGKTFEKGFFEFVAPPGVNVVVEGKNQP